MHVLGTADELQWFLFYIFLYKIKLQALAKNSILDDILCNKKDFTFLF